MIKSQVVRAVVAAFGLSACFSAGMAAAAPREIPDLGLITNADGDNAFRAETLEESQKLLRAEVDGNADVGVKTFCYSIASGSEIMLYPTKVGSTWGWRKTKYDEKPEWGPRIDRNRRNMEAGGDGPRTVGEQAKKRGMCFFPSQRMNDGHYCFGTPPEEYPLTGRFWLENRDLVIKDSPVKARPEYGQLLDYSQEKVRNYRLAQAYEAMDRYQHLMDGYELDFTRFQIFFPAGKAWERRDLMTDVVRKVRQHLDELGKANGKAYALIARIPPAPHNCQWAGLDVAKWASDGLVDVIVPSQMMNMGFEQPIDKFVKMVQGTGVRVYAGLLPRVGWSWELTPVDRPTVKDFGRPDRQLSIPQLRAVAMNSQSLGADGLYLFNFSHYARWGKTPSGPKAVRLAEPQTLATQDQVYSISKAYWYDNEDGYEYRKQLPETLTSSEAKTFKLHVGANVGDAKVWQALRRSILRLGFRDLAPGTTLSVKLNGNDVLTDAADAAIVTTDPADAATAKIVKAQKDLASDVLPITLKDVSAIHQGQNEVTVSVKTTSGARGAKPPTLTDIDLGLFFGDVDAEGTRAGR
jgi:hypothetical protein